MTSNHLPLLMCGRKLGVGLSGVVLGSSKMCLLLLFLASNAVTRNDAQLLFNFPCRREVVQIIHLDFMTQKGRAGRVFQQGLETCPETTMLCVAAPKDHHAMPMQRFFDRRSNVGVVVAAATTWLFTTAGTLPLHFVMVGHPVESDVQYVPLRLVTLRYTLGYAVGSWPLPTKFSHGRHWQVDENIERSLNCWSLIPLQDEFSIRQGLMSTRNEA